MTLMATQDHRTFRSDDERWGALLRRDDSADGQFVYSVKTTGVYCRPTCAARLAKRQNIEFYATPAQAQRAGFRPCLRCRPDALSPRSRNAEAIADACRRIVQQDVVDVDALAASAGMSSSHFHRVFKSVTGLTPKAYANAQRSQRVRKALHQNHSVTSAIYKAGFGSSGRFYASSAKLLGMTPAAFRGGGVGTTIRFAVGECSLGSILVAATDAGVCTIALGDDPDTLVKQLQDRFANAELLGGDKAFERVVAKVVAFVERPEIGLGLPLDVRGTVFQQRVWQKLCEIPCGETRSYAQIARELGQAGGARAVAGACTANEIAVVIPCHRVVRTDGSLSGYRWGVERKARLLDSERRPDGQM